MRIFHGECFCFLFLENRVAQLCRISPAAMMINKCCNQFHFSIFAYRAQGNVFAGL